MPDFSQARIDIFENDHYVQSYRVDQALCDYDHILDNLHALNALLDATVDAGTLTPVASATFLLDTWDYREFVDKLSPRQTEKTAAVIAEVDATYFARDGVEIYATESLYGTWYKKP